MALRLLHFEACPFCEKVRLTLSRLGLEYQSTAIDPADRAEVERLSGQRLVPVLCDGDRIIPDSTRIVRYLVARYGERGLLPPGAADQALAWIVEDYADEVLGALVHAALKERDVRGAPLAARDLKEVDKHLETQFRNLDQLLSERPYIIGSAPSLADIAVYVFLAQMVRRGGHDISAGFPRLKGWYGRMEALEAATPPAPGAAG